MIRSYEHWLIGRPFIAVIDSQAMLSLMKQKHLSLRQWRTFMYLSNFDITFEFIEGKKNVIADLLSKIVEQSMYRYNLPYLKESDTHLTAIQLRYSKTLLEKPLIKKRRSKTESKKDTKANMNMSDTCPEKSDLSEGTDQ
jgi:hypothetical protein